MDFLIVGAILRHVSKAMLVCDGWLFDRVWCAVFSRTPRLLFFYFDSMLSGAGSSTSPASNDGAWRRPGKWLKTF